MDLQFAWSGYDGAGQDDYTPDGDGHALTALAGETVAGHAELIVVCEEQPNSWLEEHYQPGDVYVAWIETAAAFRRQGVAAALVAQIRRRFPDSKFVTGGFDSEAGEEFWNACVENGD